MSPEYKTFTEGIAEAEAKGDLWQVVRLCLKRHELTVMANPDDSAGLWLSRNRLLKAIDRYVKELPK